MIKTDFLSKMCHDGARRLLINSSSHGDTTNHENWEKLKNPRNLQTTSITITTRDTETTSRHRKLWKTRETVIEIRETARQRRTRRSFTVRLETGRRMTAKLREISNLREKQMRPLRLVKLLHYRCARQTPLLSRRTRYPKDTSREMQGKHDLHRSPHHVIVQRYATPSRPPRRVSTLPASWSTRTSPAWSRFSCFPCQWLPFFRWQRLLYGKNHPHWQNTLKNLGFESNTILLHDIWRESRLDVDVKYDRICYFITYFTKGDIFHQKRSKIETVNVSDSANHPVFFSSKTVLFFSIYYS